MQVAQVLSVEDLKETFIDAEYAVSTLKMIQDSIPEDEVEYAMVEVNAGGLRSCLELLLSMLEVYEGMNVKALEDYQQVKDCLMVHSSDSQLVVQLQIH